MNRIARDVLILVAFCSAFYMLTRFVGAKDQVDSSRSNFSQDRLIADEGFRIGDWQKAIKHYRNVLKEDPYNELAILRVSTANMMQTEYRVAVLQEQRASKNSDETKTQEINEQIASIIEESIKVQKELGESDQYRSIAARNCILLHCFAENKKAALTALGRYVKMENNVFQKPITFDPRLSILWQEPDFIRLYHEENAFYRR